MQKIYRRTPIPKCDFNKVALKNSAFDRIWRGIGATLHWMFKWKVRKVFECGHQKPGKVKKKTIASATANKV